MESRVHALIRSATGAGNLTRVETIQSLWSGYGSIDRYRLSGSKIQSVVVKHVRFQDQQDHPRGWNTAISHQRKLRSYQVETAWYQHWASHCNSQCRVPRCYAVEQHDSQTLMVLEDLDAAGFAARRQRVSNSDMIACLQWLAHFHAIFMDKTPQGLWPSGSYWHLQTRPDELAAMAEGPLKQAAGQLDQLLTAAPFATFIHGDAKLANFCFAAEPGQVAAVDFQYTGGGCGMKDVAYFIGSCLNESECERLESDLLNAYFSALKQALNQYHPRLDAAQVEAAWRPLYAVAWADFHRFLQGWSPDHWKIHRYTRRLTDAALGMLAARGVM